MTITIFLASMALTFVCGCVAGVAIAFRMHSRDAQEQMSASHSKMQPFDVLDVCEEKEKE